MRRAGAVMFWIGLVVCVVSLVVGFALGGRLVDRLGTVSSDAAPMVDGTATVELAEGERRGVYERTTGESSSPQCTVEGPDGADPGFSEGFGFVLPTGQSSLAYVGDFQAPVAGSYTVSCTGGTTVLGPSLDLGSLGSGLLGVVGGILGFLFGAFLVLLGGILWLVGRSRDRKRVLDHGYPQQAQGGPPPPPSW